jgi:hypothetical protein
MKVYEPCINILPNTKHCLIVRDALKTYVEVTTYCFSIVENLRFRSELSISLLTTSIYIYIYFKVIQSTYL